MECRIFVSSLAAFSLIGTSGCSGSGIDLESDADEADPDAVDAEVPSGDAPEEDAHWDLPVEDLGEPGWRDSGETLCRPGSRAEGAVEIWSDERGVFVTSIQDGLDIGTSLLLNDGTGWITLIGLLAPVSTPHPVDDDLEGIPGGVLWHWSSEGTFLSAIEAETGEVTWEEIGIHDLHVVDATLAYALTRGSPGILEYDGSLWHPLAGELLPTVVTLVWSDGDALFCAGENGTLLTREGTHWVLHDTRTLSDFSAIWGFAWNDVWMGTEDGTLHHYDGEGWNQVEWPDLGDDASRCRKSGLGIEGMWGHGSTLFFHTRNQIVRRDGSGFTTLGYWPGIATSTTDFDEGCYDGLHIFDIWGNATDEVFIAARPSEPAPGACSEYLLWWDGEELHRF